AMVREYIAICRGLVGKRGEAYISREALLEWRKQQEDAAEYLDSNFLAAEHETDTGEDWEIIQLSQAAKSGTSNPEIRRLEMMTRIRGMKEAAEAANHTAVFITWTAPGAYHNHAGAKWNGADPRDTQKYLRNQWAKTRAELDEAGISFSGLRVVEPHNDETPHWHMLLFVAPEKKTALASIMRRYAMQHDADEPGAKEHRFTVEQIDPAKGCAVAYIAKYISKSINANHVAEEADKDGKEETGETISSAAEKCRAWASRWRLRQFQFVGSPPVTIWRELRRIREPLTCKQLEPIREAADKGRFADFIALMGGIGASRKDYPVNVIKKVSETSNGTIREKIAGIISAAGGYMITRKNWQQIGNAFNTSTAELANPHRKKAPRGGSFSFALSAFELLQGGSRAAWTRENNCKLDQESINEKLASVTNTKPAIVGYLDRLGRWIVEKVSDYLYEGEAEWVN
ncbi:replication endonuclease, partial [Burkholderia vietnamiensis]|uniref:replication endonuclease n=1 Tax=Burkholderia vietnamiensis TaxID=60552 RepID=UPI00352E635B